MSSVLTHQVSVSLHERSICPYCGEGTMHVEPMPDGRREALKCHACDYVEHTPFRRWRMLYPNVPQSPNRDVFRSLEKLDPHGNLTVEFAADIDGASQEAVGVVHEKLKRTAGDVFDVYSSGSKGFHIQLPYEKWRYANPKWPAVFRRLAEHLDMLDVIDTAIYMPNAMLRVEGSVNTKSGRRKTLIHKGTLDAPLPAWDELVAQAEREAPQPKGGTNTREHGEFKLLKEYTPPCIQALWLDGLPAPGTRHLAYLHLISYHQRRGDDEDTCLENMKTFAEEFSENTNSPLPARLREAERLTSLAYRQGISFDTDRCHALGLSKEDCKLCELLR